MPRIARVVVPEMPHHITQRGNYQQLVFLDDSDRKQYLLWIKEYSQKYGVSILAYSLMDNHMHHVAIPKEKDSLARTFNTAHMRYSQYFNKKMGTKGHLWQGRFYSCVLDEPHLISTARYVERNSVRAGIVSKPCEWRWSSALDHIAEDRDKIITLGNLFDYIHIKQSSWKNFIESSDDKKIIDAIRKHTLTGRPLGSEEFVKGLERRFGRRLIALPKGRPKGK